MAKKSIEYTLSAKRSSFDNIQIKSSEDACNYARQFYHEDMLIYESVFIILLNRANKTIGYAKISQGGTISSVVDIKIVCKYAVDSLASGIILVHNHPSGNKMPSDSDIKLSKNLKKALSYLECNLLDSIIITENEHYSIFEEGLL